MQCQNFVSLFRISRTVINSSGVLPSQTRSYAKAPAGIMTLGKKGKLGKSAGPTLEKKIIPVETDPKKLVNYVCGSNINKEGEDVKIGEDKDYPDWLWNLRLGPPPPLESLDPNTYYYWFRHRKEVKKRTRQVLKMRKF